jgi:EAL domain-containing protein (putative c-di-GMP-specific phosphodiesterase class I)
MPAQVAASEMLEHKRQTPVEHIAMAQQPGTGVTPPIAFISVSEPSSLITRFMLYASTCKLISVLTRSMVRVRKWVAPSMP